MKKETEFLLDDGNSDKYAEKYKIEMVGWENRERDNIEFYGNGFSDCHTEDGMLGGVISDEITIKEILNWCDGIGSFVNLKFEFTTKPNNDPVYI